MKAFSIGMLAGFGLPRRRASKLAVLLVAIAIIPIVVLTLATAGPRPEVPLSGDAATLVRIFLVIPLLVTSASNFSEMIHGAVHQPVRAELIPSARQERYKASCERLVRLSESTIAGFACLAIAIVSAILTPILPGPFLGLSHWGADASGALNAAGIWYAFVVMPLLRFILLMWLWRALLWVFAVWRLPSFDLQLQPAHPDGCAGIGYLGFVQLRLSVLLIAMSSMLAGSAANRILYLQQSFQDVAIPILIYIVFYSMLLIAPLLLLAPLLLRVKRQGVLQYGQIGQDLARRFHANWVDGRVEDPLESPNPSAMADFAAVHATVRDMAIIPISARDFGWMMLSCCGPFLFLIFIFVPVDVLLKSALTEIPPMELIADVAKSTAPASQEIVP